MRFLALIMLAVLAACSKPEPAEVTEKRARARLEIFYKCLELAKINQNQTHYSDNDEVISECSTQSYYLSNSLIK